ncbi:MAG: amidase [Thermoleophilia bacterium]|nr:amidase [Thermoleophilia bacterium]
MDDLHYLPATEALARFRSRELSPVELARAVIARAEATEPHVNALPVRFFDELLADARAAERRYLGVGPRPRPLEGLPIAVKEETPVAGQPWTRGSLLCRDAVADHTTVVVERILRAGGIIHARSATPEFSLAPFTHSRLWGVTRNPWHPDFSAGGSSGGSGAALAAGSATLATGSDIGGSIRIPASFCGVVGFKPPYGRVPEETPFNLDHWCHQGPLARTVADCALLQNVIAGPHRSDGTSLRPKLRIPARLGGVEGWRIAYSPDLGGFPVDADVARNLLAALDALREAGARVEEVELGWDHREILEAARIHYGALFPPAVAEAVREHGDEMTAYAVAFVTKIAAVSKEDIIRGFELECRLYERLGRVLERHRLLVCPTFPLPALLAGEDYLERNPVVNGVEQGNLYDLLMPAAFNLCSRCPVLAVPAGIASSGVPTGISIVGRTYDDVSVFRAAAALERARPWLDVPERRPRL